MNQKILLLLVIRTFCHVYCCCQWLDLVDCCPVLSRVGRVLVYLETRIDLDVPACGDMLAFGALNPPKNKKTDFAQYPVGETFGTEFWNDTCRHARRSEKRFDSKKQNAQTLLTLGLRVV
jgi:hypothetical protein